MYSYSLDFICLDPLGSTNYGKLTNVQLNVETEPNLSVCGVAQDNCLVAQQVGGQDNDVQNQTNFGLENSAAMNMSHAGIVESLFITGNCNQASSSLKDPQTSCSVGGTLNGAFCEVPYQIVLTAVNNNIIRISGGALGFPVL